MKKFFIIFLLFIISSFMVSAFTDSTRDNLNGYDKKFFYGSYVNPPMRIDTDIYYTGSILDTKNSFDTEILLNEFTTSSSISSLGQILFSDKMSSAPNTAIISFDSTSASLKYFEATDHFVLKGQYQTGTLTSNFEIFDYDADGYDEIVFANNTGVGVIRYNSTSGTFNLISSLNIAGIVNIRCANLTGYETNKGFIGGSGQECLFEQSNHSLYLYDHNFSNLYMNNMTACSSTQTQVLPDGTRYPLTILDFDDDNYFDIASFCSDGGTSPANTINIKVTESSGTTLLYDTIQQAIASTYCTSNGVKSYPIFMGALDWTGDGHKELSTVSIYCDNAGDQKFQWMSISIYNRNGKYQDGFNISVDHASCDTGLCKITQWMQPMIFNMERYSESDEICIGYNNLLQPSTTVLNDYFRCYTDAFSSPIVQNYSTVKFDSSFTGSYIGFLGENDIDSQFERSFYWMSRYGVNELKTYENDAGTYTRFSNDLIFPLTNTSATSYFISPLNNDNFYDIIGIGSSGLIGYTSYYANTDPNIISWSTNTGSPICKGSSIKYTVNATDSEGDLMSLSVNCGNTTVSTSFLSELSMPLSVTCTYSNAGEETPTIIITDSRGLTDSLTLDPVFVVASSPPNCFITGSGGTSSISSSSSSDSFNALFVNPFSGWNQNTKIIIALIIIILTFIIGMIAVLSNNIVGKILSIVTGSVILFEVILFAVIGWFPIWIIFFMVILGAGGLIGIFFKLTSNNTGGQ